MPLPSNRRGYIALAPDLRNHGSRQEGPYSFREALCASYRAYEVRGKGPTDAQSSYILDNVWDIQGILDYLQMRPDVDPNRIGIYGVGFGGTVALIAAATDERVAVCCPVLGVVNFR